MNGVGFGTGCTALTKISLPNTLTSISEVTAPNLELYDLPRGCSNLDEGSINFFTEVTEGGITCKGLKGNNYIKLFNIKKRRCGIRIFFKFINRSYC